MLCALNKIWYVYIIQDINKRFYIGITIDIDRRLRQHNGLVKGGAKATRAGRPWKIVYVEELKSKSDALKREIRLKKFSHKEKSQISGEINDTNKSKQ